MFIAYPFLSWPIHSNASPQLSVPCALRHRAPVINPASIRSINRLCLIGVGLPTIYATCKAADPGMIMKGPTLRQKHSGKSGGFMTALRALDLTGFFIVTLKYQ